jgi:hypothetical protein
MIALKRAFLVLVGFRKLSLTTFVSIVALDKTFPHFSLVSENPFYFVRVRFSYPRLEGPNFLSRQEKRLYQRTLHLQWQIVLTDQ